MNKFEISSKFKPDGDQPQAIKKLTAGLKCGAKFQTLLGVTGSGKTFTMANVIENVQKPTLVIAPNKTLAAQLAQEFRTFFPKNAVEYFVSYYDYYQPEAYISSTDTYIEKEADINDEIDRLRHAATVAVLSRKDAIVVASVSCIYGLGSPEYYSEISLSLKVGKAIDREKLIKDLTEMHFVRSEMLSRGKFRAQGKTVEIMSPSREIVTRIELRGEKVRSVSEYDFLTGEALGSLEKVLIYPAKHFVVPEPVMQDALSEIEKEMRDRVDYFKKNNKLLEAERIYRRTKQDLEMMREIGYCNGIENYSRYLTGRKAGEPPYTLIDYFAKNFLIVIDESHVTVPQLNGMYNGDHARKKALVDNGFRLPSAYDNRPLKFSEFENKINQVIFTSATPAEYERTHSTQVAEQIIRPTGLVDPELVLRPAKGQVKDVMAEIQKVVDQKERVLVTTLTKKMAEDLADFLKEQKIKAEYLHSGVATIERVKILEDLRRGKFDVLVGVNLLREGLDLPEVSLVAILDADKEGFLRSETSLVQTIGRAARNISGRVILYADQITGSMKRAIDETNRRRKAQTEYNKKHHITPKTIKKKIASIVDHELKPEIPQEYVNLESLEDIAGYIKQKEAEMKIAARNLEFERAAVIRDEIVQLRKLQMG
ncbi:MAG: excinuclease ABC subunit UvrB [Patescibacteria group bacterium]|nr:excinuclease ABC subunit UvrB [Patescibacteria group bacterium]